MRFIRNQLCERKLFHEIMTKKGELLPFPAFFWVIMGLSLVAARSLLAGFERLNREVQVLLHSMSLNSILKKKEVVGDVSRLVGLQPTHQHSAKTALLIGLT